MKYELLNKEKAWEKISMYEKNDPPLGEFLLRAHVVVLTRVLKREGFEGGQFDLLFFVNAMCDLFEQRKKIANLCAGKTNESEWGPDW